MQDAKEEVRSRLNIEDVIGEYVQLKRSGRNFKGLSPFSGEKTPSFYVSPEKHIWHDFSSNKGGDVFSFVMEVEGMDFRQALERLAQKAGVDLSHYQSKGGAEITQRKKRLQAANELAAQYYQHSLLKNPHALEYVFKKRGLNKQIVQEFRIGYAPEAGDALMQFLTKKGFTKRELSDAGLSNRFGGDLFRGRMMVPLMDAAGQVIGFTGRVLAEAPNAPKYLNTPQTLIYDKSWQVFGLSQAKQAIRINEYAVVVEGNLDVVSSHQAGVTGVVATAGTAMTEYHLRALRRFAGTVRLAFDGDRAGLAATERAIPLAANVGLDLMIITLPDGVKDPDELIQRDVKLWHRAIDEAIPAIEWILQQYQHREDLKTATGKRAFTTAALAVVKALGDPVEREHYEQKIAAIVGTTLDSVKAKVESNRPVLPVLKPVLASPKAKPDPSAYQDNLLAVAVVDVECRRLLAASVQAALTGEARQAVAAFLENTPSQLTDTPPQLQNFDTYVKILLLKAEARYASWNESDRYFEAARLVNQVENEHKKQTQQQLVHELRQAEEAGNDKRAEQLRIELNTLIKEITRGQR